MALSPRGLKIRLAIVFLGIATSPMASRGQAQTKTPAPSPNAKPAAQTSPGTPAAPAPQSTHFPILLLLQGSDESWDLRIGQKGPERLNRNGYPPIPLEAGEVVREGTGNSWTYHAKDMQTGATVSARISREPCAGVPAAAETAKGKWTFSALVEHSQLGTLEGCARVATDLFPRINNQLTPSDDDENSKPKTLPPTITKFKSPVFFAYAATSDKVLVKRGTQVKSVLGKVGSDLCLSHDGKKLLFSRESEPGTRSIYEFDLATGQAKQLIPANASEPFWSPDDSRIAFVEIASGRSQLWVMPADAPDKAAPVSQNEVTTLSGWTDATTLLTSDLQTLTWMGTDGTVKQTVAAASLYGSEQFKLSSANNVRIHPLNPDLLVVSAEVAGPLQPPITVYDIPNPALDAPKPPKKDEGHPAQALFLYEVRAKRRVLLSPLNLTATQPEWSRDGLQVFFTGRPSPSSAPTIYRLFWDGTSLTKIHDGSDFVVGD